MIELSRLMVTVVTVPLTALLLSGCGSGSTGTSSSTPTAAATSAGPSTTTSSTTAAAASQLTFSGDVNGQATDPHPACLSDAPGGTPRENVTFHGAAGGQTILVHISMKNWGSVQSYSAGLDANSGQNGSTVVVYVGGTSYIGQGVPDPGTVVVSGASAHPTLTVNAHLRGGQAGTAPTLSATGSIVCP